MIHPSFRSGSTSLLVATFLLAGSVASAAAQGASGVEVLTNESVTQMVTGKVPKDLILTKVRTTKSAFDLTPTGLIALHAAKVGDDIVKAMIQSAPTSGARETLNDEAIIQMVNGLVSREIILLKVQGARADYDLTTNGIIKLNQAKVSQDVIKAMMAATAGTAPPKKP